MGKTKKRGNGEGTIYQQKKGQWVSQVTIGTDPSTGKPKRRTFTGKTRAEVAKKQNEVIAELNKGLYIEPSTITLEEWTKDCLKARKPHIEESTWNNYERFARLHVFPEIGNIMLKDLKQNTFRI